MSAFLVELAGRLGRGKIENEKREKNMRYVNDNIGSCRGKGDGLKEQIK